MRFGTIVGLMSIVALAACEGGGGAVSFGGNAAVGVSSGGSYDTDVNVGGAGPAPGRTQAARQERKDYYRGPRGNDF